MKILKINIEILSILLLMMISMSVISCSSSGGDDDQDGIPDSSERQGATYFGMPLYDWGARPGQRDIFVHVAMMEPSLDGEGYPDGGMILQKKALDRIAARFAANGIALHFDVGNTGLYEGYTELTGRGVSQYNFSNKSHIIPYNRAVTLRQSVIPSAWQQYADNYVFVDDIKANYFPSERWNAFYFLVIGSTQAPLDVEGVDGPLSSGIAWVGGRDFLVTLGEWGLFFGTATSGTRTYTQSEVENLTVNFQASTIMHELGHNLGLRHGGNSDINDKPNYISIMNYLYQLYGLPKIGSDEGDRYYHSDSAHSDSFDYLFAMEQSVFSDDFLMDYSHGRGGSLNENALYESQGLKQPGSAWVDWNRSSTLNSTAISLDVNNDSSLSSSLGDFNDWDNLFLYYYEYSRSARSAADSSLDVVAEEPRSIEVPSITRSVY